MLVLVVLTLVCGLGVGLARGGTLSALARVHIYRPWLFASLVLALSIGRLIPVLHSPGWIVAAVLAALFAASNDRLPGLGLLLVGIIANAAAVTAGGGEMPVSEWAAAHAGVPVAEVVQSDFHRLADSGTSLRLLTDIIPFPFPGLRSVVSIGDVLVAASFAVLGAVTPVRARRTLEARRNAARAGAMPSSAMPSSAMPSSAMPAGAAPHRGDEPTRRGAPRDRQREPTPADADRREAGGFDDGAPAGGALAGGTPEDGGFDDRVEVGELVHDDRPDTDQRGVARPVSVQRVDKPLPGEPGARPRSSGTARDGSDAGDLDAGDLDDAFLDRDEDDLGDDLDGDDLDGDDLDDDRGPGEAGRRSGPRRTRSVTGRWPGLAR